MKLTKKQINKSFFLDLFFKDKAFPPFYKKITNLLSKNVSYNCNSNSKYNPPHIYTIIDIPSYYSIEFSKDYTYLKSLTTPLYSGYLINLTAYNNLEDYLNNKLGKARKSQLKRYRKRLDLCISPIYKIFYGDITKEEYTFLFKELVIMTKRRFTQKEESNFELPFLKLYENMMYKLILEKKASIFTIYDNDKPINISLNFTDQDTVFHWNSCYNIDYQMFNLGHINMVNHLEWAYKNEFKLFDMSRGDFFHKRKYVNESYTYNANIIYNPSKLSNSFKANLQFLKLKIRYAIIQLLKKYNLHLWYSKYLKYKYRLTSSKNNISLQNNIKIDNIISEIPNFNKQIQINLNKNKYAFLIRSLNYFLHKNQEQIKNVTIYNDFKHKQTYYFKGAKTHQKITIID
ncbi:hypothetical protein A8C32_03530 [Flavivirga aquatica]|uniref:BioF2-like acetyltransferase domain-containing protein n=1 Tax=Flavivirga aquatica TaxID=1849968 RepID=A0A1E5TB40_9FLAO|nr:GNAT family N-acetyltransferase [Flavivirga aquatica]OEK08537.1 hypothetical protein A8C32_03530 [Flavivirga aquatica]